MSEAPRESAGPSPVDADPARPAGPREGRGVDAGPLGTHALEAVPAALPAFGEPGAPYAVEPDPGGERTAGDALREGLGAFSRLVRVPVLVLALYTVLFNLSVVRGNSMAPGIHDGDRILVEPWSYFFTGVNRGDVVVLRYPLDPTVDYIKRVVGLPGDRVRIRQGRVWINGEALPEPYVAFGDPNSFLDTIVEAGHYFVLGDNRPRSSDSRDFGQVPADFLRGRVDLRLWPLERIGFVD